jgi:tungstate transport system substrate-binding protein
MQQHGELQARRRQQLSPLTLCVLAACHGGGEVPAKPPPQTIRVAVIGGMLETGFWQEIAARYERLSGNKIELAASGPKPVVVDAFRKGGIDLITFHASDAFANLVADGLAVDPQPWVRNDLVIVGPKDDPAGVRGEHDAITAVKKIIDAKASFVVHASMGADGVLHDIMEAGHLVLPAGQTIAFGGENQHAILDRAFEAHAYTMVGRIPFLDGKLKRDGIEMMVRGDVKLRRPYLVAVAAGSAGDPRLAAARDLAAYLRAPETQAFIASFGKGKYDDESLFFPVIIPRAGD